MCLYKNTVSFGFSEVWLYNVYVNNKLNVKNIRSMTKKEIISQIMNLVNLFGKRNPINPISKYFDIYKGPFYIVFVDVDTNDHPQKISSIFTTRTNVIYNPMNMTKNDLTALLHAIQLKLHESFNKKA